MIPDCAPTANNAPIKAANKASNKIIDAATFAHVPDTVRYIRNEANISCIKKKANNTDANATYPKFGNSGGQTNYI